MLSSVDPEIYALCEEEKKRQANSINLIASENFASPAVLAALGSHFHNKYSEGYAGARYYAGNEFVDKMERLCIERALQLFNLSNDDWGVNVQALSGSPANLAVYTGAVGPHGRILGLSLPDGGHLTHGFFAPSGKKVSASSLFFESMPYTVDKHTGLIDYDNLAKLAKAFRPKMIVAGVSAYSRALDYGKFREIADSVGAYLLADMAHVSGLVASGLHPSPFEYADFVTTTTHKTLRAARGALIFYRRRKPAPPAKRTSNGTVSARGDEPEQPEFIPTGYEKLINEAVFPGLQGGPHNNNIAGIAVGLHEALQPAYKQYITNVVDNCRHLSSKLQEKGYQIVTGGTDTHMLLLDLRPQKIDGARLSSVLEEMGIILNKNSVPGDVNMFRPSGVRIGTPAMTTRGFGQKEMDLLADFIDEGAKIATLVSATITSLTLKDFIPALKAHQEAQERIARVRLQVQELVAKFPAP